MAAGGSIQSSSAAPPLVQAQRGIAAAAGGALSIGGLLVMSGWVLRHPFMQEMFSTGTAMVFNAALCFTLCGFALLFRHAQGAVLALSRGCAALVVLISAIVLVQTALGLDSGLDQPMLHSWLADGNPHPGRMAPNGAAALLAAGLALALWDPARRRRLVPQVLATIVLTIGVLGLVAYTSLLDLAYTWFRFPRISIAGAAATILLGATLHSEFGLLQRRPARNDGAALTMFFSAAVTILVSGVIATFGSFHGLLEREHQVSQAHEAISELQESARQHEIAHLNWRLHLQHRDSASLEAFTESAATLSMRLWGAVRSATRSGQQQALLAELVPAVLEDVRKLRDSLNTATNDPMQAEAAIEDARDRHKQSRLLLERLVDEERRLLVERHDQMLAATGSTLQVIIGANSVGLALLLYALLVVRRQSARQRSLDRTLKQMNRELEDLYNNSPCGYHSVDADGMFLRMNDTELRWLGYRRDELIGKMRHHDIHTPESLKKFVTTFAEFKRSGVLHDAEFEYRRKDGTTLAVSLSATAIVDDSGNYVASRSALYDITERKKAEQALSQANLCLDAIVENIPHTIFLKDANDLRYLRLNRAGEQLLGLERSALVGKRDCELFPAQADAWMREDQEVLATRRSIRIDNYPFRNQDGDVRFVRVAKIPLTGTDGTPRYLLGIAEDITEQLRLEEQLRQSSADADAANRAKTAFLAAMSHEIRTPMNGVIGMVGVLRETELMDEQRAMLETLSDSAAALLELIDSILDFSKIEAGKLELEKAPVSLRQVAESACEVLAPLADEKAVDLLLYCDPGLPAVLADAARFRQILLNLAGNAIKFTSTSARRAGRVFVRLDAREVRGGRAAIQLAVRDNGIGMDSETVAKLFRPFAQADASTRRRFGGTGLGLAIARRIVDAMEGSITVHSVVDQGSEFVVDVEFDVAATDPAPPESCRLQQVSAILLGLDREVLNITRSYLTAGGVRIVAAPDDGSVSATLEAAAERGVAVLVDSPGDGGFAESARDELRARTGRTPLQFVVLARGRRRRARLQDTDTVTLDYTAMRQAALVRAVAVAAGRASPDFAYLPKRFATVAAPEVRPIEAPGARILVVEDNATNQKVLMHQLGLLGIEADLATDGQEGLTLWRVKRHRLVLTDCHMPVLDGFDLARTIRAEEDQRSKTSIIAITANALRGEADRCHQAGMDDVLTKPVQLDVLRENLVKWLGLAESRQALFRVPAADPAIPGERRSPPADPRFDAGALTRVVGITDIAELAGYYDEFLRLNDDAMRDLRAAYASADRSAVQALAHKLKSSARTVGANAVAQCYDEIEHAAKAADWSGIAEPLSRLETCVTEAKTLIDRTVRVSQ